MTQKPIEPHSPPASDSQIVSRTEYTANGTVSSPPIAETESMTGELTFITDEGERIIFPDMGMPLAEATVLASEEALGRIWYRSKD